MPRSGTNTTLRKSLQRLHRTIASLLPLPARRRYLYLASQGRLPRLQNPRLFTEKINRRILHDRLSELAWTWDKLAIKDYATGLHRETGVEVHETLWSGDDLRAVPGRTFDRLWVLKPNHRSCLVRFGRASESIDARTVESTTTWLGDDQGVLLDQSVLPGEWAQARELFLTEGDIAAGEHVDNCRFPC